MGFFTQALGLSESVSLAVSSLYKSDASSRLAILQTLASRNLSNEYSPVDSGIRLGDAMCLICLKFPSASEESEPLIVASFLLKVNRESKPLPMLSEDAELKFCAKTLVALSLFLPAMNHRTTRHGAPRPDYYRSASISILRSRTPAHRALASHHRAWEIFLQENLCIQ